MSALYFDAGRNERDEIKTIHRNSPEDFSEYRPDTSSGEFCVIQVWIFGLQVGFRALMPFHPEPLLYNSKLRVSGYFHEYISGEFENPGQLRSSRL